MKDVDDLLNFWIDDVGPAGWYRGDAALDRTIAERYGDLWLRAQGEDHLGWPVTPRGMLALIILTDQFPRNMFRGDARAYASDTLARRMAAAAIDMGWDRRLPEPVRQFFYLPLMHSECVSDQERCIRLMSDRLPETGADNILHARAHREVIRRFGRFPHRNAELGRATTAEEAAFLAAGGYGRVLEDLKVAA